MIGKTRQGAMSPEAISQEVGQKLKRLRLSRNITQAELARDAGISVSTLARLEVGDNPTLDSLVRVLISLGIQQNVGLLIPDARVSPVERVRTKGAERQRSRSSKKPKKIVQWKWSGES